MNSRFAAAVVSLLLFANSLFSATDPFQKYLDWRYHPPNMHIRDIQGLQERVVDGKLHLRLREFLELVLKNSADIQMTRLDIFTAANSVISANAPFDQNLALGFNTLRSVSPLSFFTLGGNNTTSGTPNIGTPTTSPGQTVGTGGGQLPGGSQVILPQTISSLAQNSFATYTQLLPTGQSITGNFSVNRSSGDGYYFPTLFGSTNITITQHLLQNRSNIQARGPQQIARTQLLISSERSQAMIADAVTVAARQYWNAIQLRDAIRVQEQNVDLARKSYAHDKQALDLGALAKLDIYQSETQVAERNRDLIAARYSYKAALDAMRRLIGADLTPALRSTEIVLEDDASALPPRSSILPFEQALAKAVQSRPENAAAQRQTSVDNLNARIARDALLPQLDLSAQGGGSGPGFNQISVANNPSLTTNPYPGLGSTLGQVLAFNYPSYGFGLQLNFPFRNSTARANLSNALVSRARDQYAQRQTEQQIIFDVRSAINEIELADASIQAAVQTRDLAQKNAAAEQQKYELGTITAFEVLDSQTRLASSESILLNSYVNYQQAYIDYQRATWTLLDGLGMVVEMPTVH
ncbi:MAG: TolC family protein [Acidobacteriota bacterium]|nr:TolC family protein [Acidobacteriota bacterium]MDQ2840594.1 TolC family protein [Acidobacteriota bacterium]